MVERPLAQDEINGKKVEYSLVTGEEGSQSIKVMYEDNGEYSGHIYRITDFSEFLGIREKVTAEL
jgi:hypothetical protein